MIFLFAAALVIKFRNGHFSGVRTVKSFGCLIYRKVCVRAHLGQVHIALDVVLWACFNLVDGLSYFGAATSIFGRLTSVHMLPILSFLLSVDLARWQQSVHFAPIEHHCVASDAEALVRLP